MSPELNVVDYATNPDEVLARVDAVFEKGLTPGTTPSQGVSNAPLDRETLAQVLGSEIPVGQDLNVADTILNARGMTVTYFLGPASPDRNDIVTDYYTITIQVCSDACKASDVMRDCLASYQNFDADDDRLKLRPISPQDARLGDYALRSVNTLFWIRGESVFVLVSHQIDTISGLATSSGGSGSSGDDAVVTRMASLIDDHLASSWVTDPKEQRRPRPEITSGATIVAEMGKTFTVQLTNLTGAHALKTAEASDSRVAVLIEQGDADGKFVFIAMQPGETTLTLRVADAKTLTIAEVPAAVKVSAPASG